MGIDVYTLLFMLGATYVCNTELKRIGSVSGRFTCGEAVHPLRPVISVFSLKRDEFTLSWC